MRPVYSLFQRLPTIVPLSRSSLAPFHYMNASALFLNARRNPSSTIASYANRERIHILGIGNVGKLVAHSLAKSPMAPPITLLFHRPELASDWDAAGHCIEVYRAGTSDKQQAFEVEVVSGDANNSEPRSTIKSLIVATKTHQTVAAIKPLRNRLSNESTILFLQNGMGAIEEVASCLASAPSLCPHYLAGIVSHGIYSVGPFSIVHAGLGSVSIGAICSPNAFERLEATSNDKAYAIPDVSQYLFEQFLHAPLLEAKAISPSQLLQSQLKKLAVNAIINPLTAILNCPNGHLFGRPPIDGLIQRLLSEISAVLRKLIGPTDKVALEFTASALGELVKHVATMTSENISSMLQDLRAGRKTEVDYINGYIVAQGAALGIDCTLNRILVGMVKERRVISEAQISHFFPRTHPDWLDPV